MGGMEGGGGDVGGGGSGATTSLKMIYGLTISGHSVLSKAAEIESMAAKAKKEAEEIKEEEGEKKDDEKEKESDEGEEGEEDEDGPVDSTGTPELAYLASLKSSEFFDKDKQMSKILTYEQSQTTLNLSSFVIRLKFQEPVEYYHVSGAAQSGGEMGSSMN